MADPLDWDYERTQAIEERSREKVRRSTLFTLRVLKDLEFTPEDLTRICGQNPAFWREALEFGILEGDLGLDRSWSWKLQAILRTVMVLHTKHLEFIAESFGEDSELYKRKKEIMEKAEEVHQVGLELRSTWYFQKVR